MKSDERIANEREALRRIRRSWIKGSGMVNHAAFEPRAKGQDRDGLSVSIAEEAYREIHRQTFESDPDLMACAVVVGCVRELGLDVVHDSIPSDPAHALITGVPDRTAGEGEHLAAKECARSLARIARAYSFD